MQVYRFCYFLGILLLCISGQKLSAQESKKAYEALFDTFYTPRILHHLEVTKAFDSVSYYIDGMERISFEQKMYDYYAISFLARFRSCLHQQKHNEADTIAHKGIEIIRAYLGDSSSLTASAYNNLGVVYKWKGDFESATAVYQKALMILEKKPPGLELLTTYDNISFTNYELGDYKQCLLYSQKVIDMLPDEIMVEHALLEKKVRAYYFQGMVERNRKEKTFGMHQFEQALSFLTKYDPSSFKKLIRLQIYQAIGYADFAQKHYQKALDWGQKALHFQQKYQIPFDSDFTLSLIGESYTYLGNYDQADSAFKVALQHAIEDLKGAKRHSRVGDVYRKRGVNCTEAGDDKQALIFFQKSIYHYAVNFEDTLGYSNPKIKDMHLSSQGSLSCLLKKAECLQRLGEKDTAALQAAISSFRVCQQLAEYLRQHYQSERSAFFLADLVRPAYEGGIATALSLYAGTGEQKYLESAFHMIESSKAALLQASLQEAELRYTALLPDSLLHQERVLQRRAFFIQKQLFAANQREDSLALPRLREEEFEVKRQVQQLLQKIEHLFPYYYHAKYAKNRAKLPEIRAHLAETGHSMINYFWGKTHSYACYLSGEELRVVRIDAGPSIQHHLNNLLAYVQQPSPDSAILTEGLQAASLLHDQLIRPLHLASSESLIILPDGLLHHLPFQTLLTSSPDIQGKSMRSLQRMLPKLPYFFQAYTLSYAYSAQLWQHSRWADKRLTTAGLFSAFAPAFDGDWQLTFNQQEAQALAEMMKGQAFLGKQANKMMFMHQASQFEILHLATHAKADLEHPWRAFVAFHPEEDSLVVDPLYAHEIGRLFLPAKLVVLSACETAKGQLVTGEGMLSLRRAFKQAGVANLLTTHWTLDDQAGKAIMEQFYSGIKEGLALDVALQASQKQYLEQADPAKLAPYFWASASLSGYPNSFERKGFTTLLYGFLGLLLVLLLVGFFLRRRRT